jgi:hypothetical protein
MTKEQKIIRAKVGLLELAKQLGNVSPIKCNDARQYSFRSKNAELIRARYPKSVRAMRIRTSYCRTASIERER